MVSPKLFDFAVPQFRLYTTLILIEEGQGCTTQISNFGQYPRAKFFFTHSKCAFNKNKISESTKFWASHAKFKAFTGHIWPAGRMLCMPEVG